MANIKFEQLVDLCNQMQSMGYKLKSAAKERHFPKFWIVTYNIQFELCQGDPVK